VVFRSYSSNERRKIPKYAVIEGTRPRGRPKKKWTDNIREDCSDMGLTVVQANRLARDRSRWRIAIQKLGCQRASTTSSSPGH